MGKLLKCHLKGQTCRKLANGQDIDYSEKIGPRVSFAPIRGLFSIIFKHVYWYIQQISGEHLQDHWSSGYFYLIHWCIGSNSDNPSVNLYLLLKSIYGKYICFKIDYGFKTKLSCSKSI